MASRSIVITAIVVALLGVVSFQLGLFDRPEFAEKPFPGLTAIVALSTDKNFPSVIPRLVEETNNIIASASGSKEAMAKAATQYGVPEGTIEMCVGVYLDNPQDTDHPRYGIGWALSTDDDESLLAILEEVQEKSTLQEAFRAVHIPSSTTIRGRIPWRTMVTPMIAPMLHWPTIHKIYTEGGYKANSGRGDTDGSVGLEVYVHGPQKPEFVDYILIYGDTSTIYDEMFPLTKASEPQAGAAPEDQMLEDNGNEDHETSIPAETE